MLHIAPARNADFRRITSPALRRISDTATSVWARLVEPTDRFLSVSTESLFGRLTSESMDGMGDWLEFVRVRYPWALA